MALCSIAIAAGVLGVVAAAKAVFFRRRFGGHGPWAFAHGPAFYGCARGRRRRHGFGGGPGGSFWLRSLFYRLDTTPGQEREIRAAIEDLQRSAHDAKEGMKAARGALAKAIGGEVFDEDALGEAQSRADASAAQLKDAFSAALRRVHAVLDAHQRQRLAEILAKGPRLRGGWRNPYRDAAV